jgi:hypothetical protein
MRNKVVEEMLRRWDAPILFRADVEKFSFGTIGPQYQAVLDSKGYGPNRYKVGRKVAYDPEEYANWIDRRYFNKQ